MTTPNPRSAVCNTTDELFDTDACYRYRWGSTKLELQREAFEDTRDYLPEPEANHSFAADTGIPCADRSFYIYEFEEFEELYPEVKKCHIAAYGAMVEASALHAPCRTKKLEEARFVMIPPYLTHYLDFPASGGGEAHNLFRAGSPCVDEILDVVRQHRRARPYQRVAIVQQANLGRTLTLPEDIQADTAITFARLFSEASFYRPGIDISMPSPADASVDATPLWACNEDLQSKKYLLSFMGPLNNALRRQVHDMYHDGIGNIICDEQDVKWSSADLAHHSQFTLVMRGGDAHVPEHFNSAVCSGGIPVIITDTWVPPFNEFVPFEDYGVLLREKDVGTLVDVLGKLTFTEKQQMRARAIVFCRHYFATVRTQVRALLNHLLDARHNGSAPVDVGTAA